MFPRYTYQREEVSTELEDDLENQAGDPETWLDVNDWEEFDFEQLRPKQIEDLGWAT